MLRFLLLLAFCLPSQASDAAGGSSINRLFLDDAQEKVLEPDQAFQLHVEARDATTLNARFTVAPGHYLYRERIHFEGDHIASTDLPRGEIKQDPNFGETEVFHHDFDAVVRLTSGAAVADHISVQVSYQGCSEKGLCYAPIRKSFDIALPAKMGVPGNTDVAADNEDSRIRTLLASGRMWLIALSFFGFGVLLSLTPCVLPMIPILSSIIVGQGNHPSRLHAFNLSLAYTLGMALAYTLAGIAAGLSGHLISNALQTPWALGIGALLFVLLAFSMFGFYELQLPSALENRLVLAANRIKGGRFAGVFVMGVLSALIVSPCVVAPLAGALLYIGQTHDVVLGGVALFALSIGMGVPLLVMGASAGALLPKAGAWMNAVRHFFGVVMLAMAVWLIGPVIPAALQLALYGVILIVSAIYLGALERLPQHPGRWAALWKGVGVVALLYGTALLVGALAGGKNPLQPLAGLRIATSSDSEHALTFRRVTSVETLDAALQAAAGKPAMLDFYADWCVSCKEYEQITFRDPRVQKILENVVLLQADVTQNSAADRALLQRFGLYGPPGIIFFDTQGREIAPMRVVGYQNAERFLVTLNELHARREDGTCAPLLDC